MSAIWGAVSFGGDKVCNDACRIFHRNYLRCKIDRSEQIGFENGIMGCELQYFTAESKREKLPIEDKGEFYFTADVYLDNREELLSDCLFQSDNHEVIPDGEILYRFYREYGSSRISEVIGSYAFAYYDKDKGYVDLVMDHTGNRCLYYANIDGILFFSTLMQPIYELCKNKMHLDDKVLTDFLAFQDYMVYTDYEATILREIRHAVAGEIIRVSGDRTERIQYWNPLSLAGTMRGKSDKEYKSLVIDCFTKSVRDAMRTDGKVGIELSGGLDSTSVACFAAQELKRKGNKLYSYTMVPKKGYVNDIGKHVNTDERPLVQETVRFLENVEEHFDSYEEMNAWDVMDEQLDMLEGPYKSMQNVMWIKHLTELAAIDGCKILLNGGFGNDTISYGNPSYYLYEMFIRGHWNLLYKELNTHTEYNRYNKRKTLKKIIQKVLRMDMKKPMSFDEFVDVNLAQESVLEQYKVYPRYLKREKELGKIRTRKQYLPVLLDKMRFRQIGDNETKISLYTGVLHKDPTKHPKLIELCIKFPTEQFDKGCTTRRIVYEYFKDFLPPGILNQRLARGRQSADFKMRLENCWGDIYTGLIRDFEKGSNIVNVKKVNQFLREHEEKFMKGEFSCIRELEWLLYADEVIRLQQRYKNI